MTRWIQRQWLTTTLSRTLLHCFTSKRNSAKHFCNFLVLHQLDNNVFVETVHLRKHYIWGNITLEKTSHLRKPYFCGNITFEETLQLRKHYIWESITFEDTYIWGNIKFEETLLLWKHYIWGQGMNTMFQCDWVVNKFLSLVNCRCC